MDENGKLFKCWECAGNDAHSFGHAHEWDPSDPVNTATDPDKMTMYLNTALPVDDEECRGCVWLPQCAGGCPHRRLFSGKSCVPFKDHPEKYVLELTRKLLTASTS
ncbi:MAG: SPASM domain-containing protein [Clostridiales bacterium]|nr:SPASM domain-containing protein [Clostridiales bacterium]